MTVCVVSSANLRKRFLQVLHGLEEFQMVRVHVQEHRDIGHQMQEGVAVFACLHHDLAPLSVAAVGVDERQLAADDGGGVT